MDIEVVRAQFPITHKTFVLPGRDGLRKLIYFDHGASTHPPLRVLNKYMDFLKNYYSNVHRGHHFLSLISSGLFDQVYETIYSFLKADKDENAIIMTANTTYALDIAASVMSQFDGITLVSLMEHHSNDLPHRRRSDVVHFGLNPDGSIDMSDLELKLSRNKVKLVAVTGASNVTGYLPDIHAIARLAHTYGAKILVDAAQLLAHKAIDMHPNDNIEHIDFLAGAGHKAYAPFGSAFLIGPRKLLDESPPYIPGGGTVIYVTPEEAYFNKSPDRHQGGTPNIAGAIALAESLKFLNEVGMDSIRKHELELTEYTLMNLKKINGIKLLGDINASERLGVISFNLNEYDNNLISSILNYDAAIATRNGCFCAHPYLHFLLGLTDTTDLRKRLVSGEEVELPGAVRVTIGIFNNKDEVDILLNELKSIASGDIDWRNRSFNPVSMCKEVDLSPF